VEAVNAALHIPNSSHKIDPDLLRGLKIIRPNQEWSTDITYVRIKNSFCLLVTVIERFWRIMKYEDIHIRNYSSLEEAKYGMKNILSSIV
jgi:hypothetical protein